MTTDHTSPTETILLPPSTPREPEPRPTPKPIRIGPLDGLLALLVLAFAFLVSSTAVRNSDFWLYLAMGRQLAEGQARPWGGEDPFCYTTSGVYWVNHAWLFDLILYGIAIAAGGVDTLAAGYALVGFKALIVTALAWVMLRTRRAGHSLWIPALSTALSILVLSPRALLQPTVLSFLFLGITVYLLHQARHAAAQHPGIGYSRRTYWLLPPLFAFWVNLDSWFFLGPVTVALYLAGDVVGSRLAPARAGADAPAPGEHGTLSLVLLVGTAACLLNPHHVRAFELPGELTSPALEAMLKEGYLAQPFRSPFDFQTYLVPTVGQNVAGLAYFLLLALSFLVLALNVRNLHPGWLAVWVGFALLSAYRSRNIPFFAVVAGPITTLTLQDFLGRRFGMPDWQVSRAWAVGGRLLSCLGVATLLAFAWPGWLHSSITDQLQLRRVSWRIEPDPSLRQLAEEIHRLREQGKIPAEERGFSFNLDLPYYFAWFCPEERSFLDTRFNLHGGTVARFIALRNALSGRNLAPASSDMVGVLTAFGQVNAIWQEIFRDETLRIRHLNINPGRDSDITTALRLADPHQWALVYTNGKAHLFAWRGPVGTSPTPLYQSRRFELERLAFGEDAEQSRAPAEGPDRSPQSPTLQDLFVDGPPSRPLAADLASFCLVHQQPLALLGELGQACLGLAQAGTNQLGERANFARVAATAAVTPGSVGLLTSPVNHMLSLPLDRAPVSPAGSLLAVRYARRAILASPDDPRPYRSLQQAYRNLWLSHEASPAEPFRQRGITSQLRQVQYVTALQHALKMYPDGADLHLALAEYYGRLNYLDFRLEHLQAYYRLVQVRPATARLDREEYARQLDALKQEIERLQTGIQRERNEYELEAKDHPVGVKAVYALGRGLAKQAKDLLVEAEAAQLAPEDVNVYLALLLNTGDIDRVREGLQPNLRASLGGMFDQYLWLAAAADGNYRKAGEAVEETIRQLQDQAPATAINAVRGFTFTGNLPPLQAFQMLNNVVAAARQMADLHVLRGLLAIEEGDLVTARLHFKLALVQGDGSHGLAFDFESRPVATNYLRYLEAARTE